MSWWSTNRAHSMRLCPSTIENNQTMCSTSGSSVKTVRKWAKSTCAWWLGGVSKRTSKPQERAGRTPRRNSLTAV